MNVIRRNLSNNLRGGPFAKGKRAIAIDQRSGFKHLQEDMVFEPGTNYYVHRDESDGGANLVTDPLNYVSDKMKRSEAIGLRYTSPDVTLSVGVIVSATALGSVANTYTFYNYPTSLMNVE